MKRLIVILSMAFLYGSVFTDTMLCCEQTTWIKTYDKKRDDAFIAERMAKDFPDDGEAQPDADPTSEPLVVFFPIPAEYQEYKEYELEIEKLMGIPKSAQLTEDKRWSQGIVLKLDKQLTFVYYIAGTPVAFIESALFGDLGVISHLSTTEKQRGKGFGRELLQYTITKMKKRGVKKIALSTSKKNDAAQHLYKKVGFKKIEIPEEFAKTGTEILVYNVQ